MKDSIDERIKRFVKKEQTQVEKASEEAQRAQDDKSRQAALLAQVQTKWADDTHVIKAILEDFAERMVTLSPQFHLVDRGAPPKGAAAVCRLTGRVGINQVAIDLRVDANGILQGEQMYGSSSAVKHTVNVVTADKAQYQYFILRILGID